MSRDEQIIDGYIITFASSHFALKAEKKIKTQKLTEQIKLISAPRTISSECGFCLLVEDYDSSDLFEKLTEMNVKFNQIYTRTIIDGVKNYAKTS